MNTCVAEAFEVSAGVSSRRSGGARFGCRPAALALVDPSSVRGVALCAAIMFLGLMWDGPIRLVILRDLCTGRPLSVVSFVVVQHAVLLPITTFLMFAGACHHAARLARRGLWGRLAQVVQVPLSYGAMLVAMMGAARMIGIAPPWLMALTSSLAMAAALWVVDLCECVTRRGYLVMKLKSTGIGAAPVVSQVVV